MTLLVTPKEHKQKVYQKAKELFGDEVAAPVNYNFVIRSNQRDKLDEYIEYLTNHTKTEYMTL